MQFISEELGEGNVGAAQEEQRVSCCGDAQAALGRQGEGAAVEGHAVGAAARRGAGGQARVRRDHQRPQRQGVRRDGRQRQAVERRLYDRSSGRQVVGRRAGGCGDDESVGAVVGHVGEVGGGVDADHGGALGLEDGDLVEGVRPKALGERRVGAFDAEQGAAFGQEPVGAEVGQEQVGVAQGV